MSLPRARRSLGRRELEADDPGADRVPSGEPLELQGWADGHEGVRMAAEPPVSVTESPRRARRIRWWRMIWVVAGALVATYVVLVGLVALGHRRLLYPRPVGGEPQCTPPGEYLVFEGPQGRRIHTVHYPAPLGEPTIVFFHGNGDAFVGKEPLLEAMAREGVGVYGVEYPGYGAASAYRPSEAAIYEDAEAALQRLATELGVPREHTVLMGHSLGTGVAVEMARRGFGARLILVAPFTSIPDVGARMLPWAPVRWFVRDRFDNLGKAPGVTLPVLVIHGTADDVVPFEMGQRLAAALPRAKLLVMDGAGHGGGLATEPLFRPEELLRFARDTTQARSLLIPEVER